MTRSERLQPVQRITEAREKEKVRALGESQQQLQQLKVQLRELEQYRGDYQRQFEQAGKAGFSAQKMIQLQQFLSNIDQAITQQKQSIVNAEAMCEEKRQSWFNARNRTQALDKVAERYRQDEQQQQNRREQKENDEFAQRADNGLTKK